MYKKKRVAIEFVPNYAINGEYGVIKKDGGSFLLLTNFRDRYYQVNLFDAWVGPYYLSLIPHSSPCLRASSTLVKFDKSVSSVRGFSETQRRIIKYLLIYSTF